MSEGPETFMNSRSARSDNYLSIYFADTGNLSRISVEKGVVAIFFVFQLWKKVPGNGNEGKKQKSRQLENKTKAKKRK